MVINYCLQSKVYTIAIRNWSIYKKKSYIKSFIIIFGVNNIKIIFALLVKIIAIYMKFAIIEIRESSF